MKYGDGSSYAGDVEEGERHGNGVKWTGNGERYEGSWVSDKPHGYGIFLGASWPFMFGRYEDGELVGAHIAWNMNSDTVLLS
jgi:hypothetical protein